MTGRGQHQAFQAGGSQRPGAVKSFVVDQIRPGLIDRGEDPGAGTTPLTGRRRSGDLFSVPDNCQGWRKGSMRVGLLDRGQPGILVVNDGIGRCSGHQP